MPVTEAAALLREGMDRLGLEPSDSQMDSLLDYLALLQRWNKSYNLTAVRQPDAMVLRHLLDKTICLIAMEF